jgi:hypothetical protein
MVAGVVSPGVTPPGREVDLSPPSKAEAKNEWSYTYSPIICLHGVDKDNYNFTLRVEYIIDKTAGH